MAKINILDSAVFNRIAAGEVVERPCSIVKELLENSIDAGANVVSVEIKDGGLSLIRVVDNGCGMDGEDIERAFVPHATSKIKDIEDLNAITTLGFRGEALTSIAAVAKVTVVSKTPNESVGHYLIIENGKIIEKGERGCSSGTCIIVENLFKNIPARAKFLSKPTTEESVITDMISRLIMTNSAVSIKYSANDRIIYQSAGNGLKNAIYAIYGKTFIDNMMPIECVMPDIKIKGYIDKPYFTKPNRTYQTLIVNGRYVVNSDISYCIYNCYRDYLMKRQFPIYILDMSIPFDMVDVNVHPSKLEVKFAGIDNIKRILYKTIKNKIDETAVIPKEIVKDDFNDRADSVMVRKYDFNQGLKQLDSECSKTSGNGQDDFLSNGSISNIKKIGSPSVEIHTSAFSPIGSELQNRIYSVPMAEKTENLFAPKAFDETFSNGVNSIPADSLISGFESNSSDNNIIPKYNFKTVLFDTYIVLEEQDSILLIDQHAAHERILYDRLLNDFESKQVVFQNMLIPYIFTVTPIEDNLLKDRLDEINSCGFSVAPLSGYSYSLSSIPLICAGLNIEKFISLIIDGLSDSRYRKANFIKDILMQSACKAAVKGEDKLSDLEISYLISQYNGNDKILMCPHGRPLVVRIGKSEIEKWFKRVV